MTTEQQALFSLGDVFTCDFKVSDEVYGGFIKVFKDENPLHTDESFAQNRGFSGRVMHGNILNGFLSYFIGECLPSKDVMIQTQDVQFKLPVYLNDVLHFTAKVDGVYESVNAVAFKYLFKNANDKVVAKGNIQIGLFS